MVTVATMVGTLIWVGLNSPGAPPPPMLPGLAVMWEFHPVDATVIAVLGVSYAWAMHRLRRTHQRWPRALAIRWYLGLAAYAAASMSAVDVYGHVLFSARAVQVTTLMMIVPQLWAHGLPLSLARDTVAPHIRRVLSRVLHARITQLITHPVVGVVVLIGLPIGLYGSGWYVAGLWSQPVDEFTRLALLAGGFHYFWTRLQQDPVPRLYPQVVTVVLTLVDVAVDSVVPLALMMTSTVVGAGYYSTVAPSWGPSLAGDQDVGAGVLWGLGDLAGIPFLLLTVAQWMRRDRAEAEQIDRHLDAVDDRPGGDRARGGPRRAQANLWWEDDAYLAEHFHWYTPGTVSPSKPSPGRDD